MFREFVRENPKTDVTYLYFREVLEKFNSKATDRLVNSGGTLYLHSGLGEIKILIVKRDPSKKKRKAIDFKATKELRAQGIQKTVYFTTSTFGRWAWLKSKCNINFHNFYSFTPTGGRIGNKKKLSSALGASPTAHIKYM